MDKNELDPNYDIENRIGGLVDVQYLEWYTAGPRDHVISVYKRTKYVYHFIRDQRQQENTECIIVKL